MKRRVSTLEVRDAMRCLHDKMLLNHVPLLAMVCAGGLAASCNAASLFGTLTSNAVQHGLGHFEQVGNAQVRTLLDKLLHCK
eukprot:SAG11_NODE_1624_length_4555_cov_3.452424_7_plen_82_part_00